jgi:hypothetical protein
MTIEDLEQAVAKLAPDDLARFRREWGSLCAAANHQQFAALLGRRHHFLALLDAPRHGDAAAEVGIACELGVVASAERALVRHDDASNLFGRQTTVRSGRAGANAEWRRDADGSCHARADGTLGECRGQSGGGQDQYERCKASHWCFNSCSCRRPMEITARRDGYPQSHAIKMASLARECD